MKKHLSFFLIIFWAISFYSCSDPELNNSVGEGGSSSESNSLIFYPPYQEVAASSEFTMDINVENVTSLVGAEIIFTYDANSVSFNSISKGSFLLSAPNNFVIDEHDSTTGTVTLTLSTAQDEGDGLTGSGSLIIVSFTLLPSITDVFNLEFSDQSRYIKGSNLNTTVSFSTVIEASIQPL